MIAIFQVPAVLANHVALTLTTAWLLLANIVIIHLLPAPVLLPVKPAIRHLILITAKLAPVVLNVTVIAAPLHNVIHIVVKPIFKPAPQPVKAIVCVTPGPPISPARIHIITVMLNAILAVTVISPPMIVLAIMAIIRMALVVAMRTKHIIGILVLGLTVLLNAVLVPRPAQLNVAKLLMKQ